MTREEQKDYGVKVTQASRTGLIVLMYEIAENYLESGMTAFDRNDIPEFRANLKKAKAVINRLNSNLDMQFSISQELQNLYLFMNRTFVKAEIRKETEEIQRIIGILRQLGAAFAQVEKTDETGPVMENTQQIYAGLTYSKNSLNEEMYPEPNRGYTV